MTKSLCSTFESFAVPDRWRRLVELELKPFDQLLSPDKAEHSLTTPEGDERLVNFDPFRFLALQKIARQLPQDTLKEAKLCPLRLLYAQEEESKSTEGKINLKKYDLIVLANISGLCRQILFEKIADPETSGLISCQKPLRKEAIEHLLNQSLTPSALWTINHFSEYLIGKTGLISEFVSKGDHHDSRFEALVYAFSYLDIPLTKTYAQRLINYMIKKLCIDSGIQVDKAISTITSDFKESIQKPNTRKTILEIKRIASQRIVNHWLNANYQRLQEGEESAVATWSKLVEHCNFPIRLELKLIAPSPKLALYLSQLTELQELDLHDSKINESFIQHLPLGLRSLNLAGIEASTRIFPHLSRLTSIEELRISRVNVSRDGLFHLPASIKRLEMIHCDLFVTDNDLSRFVNLKHVTVVGGVNRNVESLLSTLPDTVEELSLRMCHLTNDSAKYLTRFTNLKMLNVSNNTSISAPFFANLPTSIESLRMESTATTDRVGEYLGRYTKLKTLFIGDFTDITSALFSKLPVSLEELKIGGDKFDDTIGPELVRLVNLRFFNAATCPRLTDAIGQHLPVSLRKLYLEQAQLTPAFCEHLRRLRDLTNLAVSDADAWVLPPGVKRTILFYS